MFSRESLAAWQEMLLSNKFLLVAFIGTVFIGLNAFVKKNILGVKGYCPKCSKDIYVEGGTCPFCGTKLRRANWIVKPK